MDPARRRDARTRRGTAAASRRLARHGETLAQRGQPRRSSRIERLTVLAPPALLKDSLGSLERPPPRGREILAAAVDEVLDHANPRADPLGAHFLARHCAGDRPRILGEQALGWKGGFGVDAPNPPLAAPASPRPCPLASHWVRFSPLIGAERLRRPSTASGRAKTERYASRARAIRRASFKARRRSEGSPPMKSVRADLGKVTRASQRMLENRESINVSRLTTTKTRLCLGSPPPGRRTYGRPACCTIGARFGRVSSETIADATPA